ncbi:hypothetical protein MKW98_009763 [Papaver atlanticum]|uniref:Uncharacterized protein n=1 Tax=Papaver atlanticum TaxID=357466 RepID=A0AAD4SX25_9MAGN|nr:hypothetical protein MKW98_009763 [Papaver atlanticum]
MRSWSSQITVVKNGLIPVGIGWCALLKLIDFSENLLIGGMPDSMKCSSLTILWRRTHGFPSQKPLGLMIQTENREIEKQSLF